MSNPITRVFRTLAAPVQLPIGAGDGAIEVAEIKPNIILSLSPGEGRVVVRQPLNERVDQNALFEALERIPVTMSAWVDLSEIRELSVGLLGVLHDEFLRRTAAGGKLVTILRSSSLNPANCCSSITAQQLREVGALLVPDAS